MQAAHETIVFEPRLLGAGLAEPSVEGVSKLAALCKKEVCVFLTLRLCFSEQALRAESNNTLSIDCEQMHNTTLQVYCGY